MHDPVRPDPDALLAQVQEAEARSRRGSLKIFFGASAGVGKTYAMLSAATRCATPGHGGDHRRGRNARPPRHRGAGARPAAPAAARRALPGPPAARVRPRRGPGLRRATRQRAGAARRAGAQQRGRLAPPQALAGRRGAAGRRHRRVVDHERAAPGEPERHRQRHHRHPRLGDRARPVLRRGRRGGGGRPAARRTAGAAQGGQGLPAAQGTGPNGPPPTSSARATCWRCASWPCAAPPTGWTTKCAPTAGAARTSRSGPTARRCWSAWARAAQREGGAQQRAHGRPARRGLARGACGDARASHERGRAAHPATRRVPGCDHRHPLRPRCGDGSGALCARTQPGAPRDRPARATLALATQRGRPDRRPRRGPGPRAGGAAHFDRSATGHHARRARREAVARLRVGRCGLRPHRVGRHAACST